LAVRISEAAGDDLLLDLGGAAEGNHRGALRRPGTAASAAELPLAMTLSLLTVIAIGVLSGLAIPLLPRHAQPAGPH
jgi:hypothetical protein